MVVVTTGTMEHADHMNLAPGRSTVPAYQHSVFAGQVAKPNSTKLLTSGEKQHSEFCLLNGSTMHKKPIILFQVELVQQSHCVRKCSALMSSSMILIFLMEQKNLLVSWL